MEAIESPSNSDEPIKIDYVVVKSASMILRSVNNKVRQQILKLLDEKKRMNVTDIYVALRLEQAVASQQLAILRNANIVSTERMGREIVYSLNSKQIEQVATLLMKFTSE